MIYTARQAKFETFGGVMGENLAIARRIRTPPRAVILATIGTNIGQSFES
jgi:hypothetical protein